MLALSRMRPSAGTASPASRITTSPGTSSWLGRVTISPSRSTLEVAAAISCRAAMAFSALLSWTTPKIALISTTTIIMMTSAKESPEYTAVIPEITAATIKMIIMGSASSLRNRWISDSFFPSARRLGPFSSRRRFASCPVSPRELLSNCWSTSSFELR